METFAVPASNVCEPRLVHVVDPPPERDVGEATPLDFELYAMAYRTSPEIVHDGNELPEIVTVVEFALPLQSVHAKEQLALDTVCADGVITVSACAGTAVVSAEDATITTAAITVATLLRHVI